MSYLFRILSCLIVFMVLNNALFGQYDPEKSRDLKMRKIHVENQITVLHAGGSKTELFDGF